MMDLTRLVQRSLHVHPPDGIMGSSKSNHSTPPPHSAAADAPSPAGKSHAPPPAFTDADLRTDLQTQAHSQWPDLPWEEAGFLEFLARRVQRPGATGAAKRRDAEGATGAAENVDAASAMKERLGDLLIPDLYLAFACLNRLPGAAETFDAVMRPVLGRALSSIVRTPGQVDDIRQAVYEKLFAPGPGVRPAIEKYDGVGALGSWVRVTGVRMALNVHRSRRRERPLSPGLLLTRPDGQTGPEESYLKRLYSGAFKQAFEQALGALAPEQRNLLRYYYLDGLTVEQVGRIHGVHKATISRRLADIREKLLTETRNRLLRALDVGQPELESILRLIHSQMDASICRYLEPDG